MDIIVGASPRVGGLRSEIQGKENNIEARILNVRPSRKRNSSSILKERRSRKTGNDPQNGKVILLFVPEDQRLPRDFTPEDYRVILKVIPRKKTG